MASGLDIPDWRPVDVGGGLGDLSQLILAAKKTRAQNESLRQNAETQRQYAANQDRKLSADLTRQAWEDARTVEQDREKKAIETSNMALPNSPVMRAARQSATLGNAVGKPYNISFDEQNTPDIPDVAGIEGPIPGDKATPTGAEAAQFLQKGGVAKPAEWPPKVSAQAPLQGPTPSGAPVPEPDRGPAPDINADAEIANRPVATTRHLYSTVAGSRIEVPTADTESLGLEPEYDKIYQHFLALNPATAEERALAVRRMNIGEMGKNTRQKASLGFRDEHTLDVEQQLADRQANRTNAAAIGAGHDRAHIAGAGIIAGGGAPGDGPVTVNPKAHNMWLSNFKNAETEGRIKQAVQNRETLDRAADEIDAGKPPNAELEAATLHTLGLISVSLGGSGRVTNQIIHDFKEATGPVAQAKNLFYRAAHGGQNDPDMVNTWREAANRLREIGHRNSLNEFRGLDRRAGRKSAYAKLDPGLAMVIGDAMDGTALNMGLDPSEIGDAVEPGAGTPSPPPAAPAAPRHHTKRPTAAPAPSPAPAAPAAPGTMTDDQAVQMAKARHDRDPNDKVAKQILELHGLL